MNKKKNPPAVKLTSCSSQWPIGRSVERDRQKWIVIYEKSKNMKNMSTVKKKNKWLRLIKILLSAKDVNKQTDTLTDKTD